MHHFIHIVVLELDALLDHFLEILIALASGPLCTNPACCLQIHDSIMPDGLHPTKGMDKLASCLSPLIYKYAKQ